MATAIGVLSARVRVEEKQIIAAIHERGAEAMIVPPAQMPIPPGPTLANLAALGAVSRDGEITVPGVMIDRIPNRAVGRVMNRLVRHTGVVIIDAGLCSRRNRLEVASAWKNAGLPRPDTLVAFTEATAVEAAGDVGYPCTLLPMNTGKRATALQDHDTADAVVEHRVVLGGDEEEIVLVQHGIPDEIYPIHVVGDDAIACDSEGAPPIAQNLAVAAAKVMFATLVRIDIARLNGQWVIWDAHPTPDFRAAHPLLDVSMGDAIAQLSLDVAEHGPTVDEEEVRRVLGTYA